MNRLNLAVIGGGPRGLATIANLAAMDDAAVTAVCDILPDRAEAARQAALAAGHGEVRAFADYRELLDTHPDAVIIAASWDAHGYIAAAAMEAGVYAGVECGGASSVEECWNLVRTYERTGTPCMFLENCCYGREEMTVLRMIRDGRFGEVIHCEGGYQHDLRQYIADCDENRQYRYDCFYNSCGEFYPAHELGPMMTYVGINRGNRMVSLTSTASKARGLTAYIDEKKNGASGHAEVTEGDVVTTVIRCAHGETLVLTHDTTLPHPYSRRGRVEGTRGIWCDDKRAVYLEGTSPDETWEPFEKYLGDTRYEHPLWTAFRASGISAGHGGMDWLVLRAFTEAVKARTAPPIDVYDGAALMCVTALSEASIAAGSAPAAIPDFTDGKWIKRTKQPAGPYALDEVYGGNAAFHFEK